MTVLLLLTFSVSMSVSGAVYDAPPTIDFEQYEPAKKAVTFDVEVSTEVNVTIVPADLLIKAKAANNSDVGDIEGFAFSISPTKYTVIDTGPGEYRQDLKLSSFLDDIEKPPIRKYRRARDGLKC